MRQRAPAAARSGVGSTRFLVFLRAHGQKYVTGKVWRNVRTTNPPVFANDIHTRLQHCGRDAGRASPGRIVRNGPNSTYGMLLCHGYNMPLFRFDEFHREFDGHRAVEPHVLGTGLALRIQPFEPLLHHVMVGGAGGLPVRGVPHQGMVALVRDDVVDQGRWGDPAYGLAP